MSFIAMYPMTDISTATIAYRFNSNVSATIGATAGIGGRSALLGADSSVEVTAASYMFQQPSSTCIVGFWYYRTDQHQNAGALFRLTNADSNYQFLLYLHPSGQLSAGYGSTYTRVTNRTLRAILTGSWSHIEVRVVTSATVGEADIYINGELALSETGIRTLGSGTAPVDSIRFMCTAYGVHKMCDMYVIDASTGSPTTVIGKPTFIYAMQGTADGFHTAWTPSTGVNRYSLVDDTLPGTWTDYISAEGSLSYTISGYAFPSTVDQVFGVMVSYDLQNTGKLVNPYLLFRASSTDYSVQLSEAREGSYADCFMSVHPITLAAWTQASVEAGEYGLTFS